jgi:Long-chain fatty acid transport protein
MNKLKFLSIVVLSFCMTPVLYAGGILTNTNQSAHFIRMLARDASLQIDAAYTNPAGLVKLDDGFHISLTNQSAFQTRTITSTYAPFAGFGGNQQKEYIGKTSAPVIPSFQVAYITGKLALSGSFGVSGGGGAAKFKDGLPSFESSIAAIPIALSAMVPTNQYSVDAYMIGSSYIFGGQLGGSYAISDMFSAYAGLRLNYVKNGYEGYLKDIKINPQHPLLNPSGGMMSASDFLNAAGQAEMAAMTADREIDAEQTGIGIAPILGLNFNYNALNIGMKYEFKSGVEVENKTAVGKDGGLPQFKDGGKTPNDIPALFTIGASYQLTPKLLASIGYHHFFDSDAKMANDKQKYIDGGINEYIAGAEYRINKIFLISAGIQFTKTGVKDDYQADLSFSLDSYSAGFGGAVNVTEKLVLNVGYFWTGYTNWTIEKNSYGGKDVFARTNKAFTVGLDYSF